jgi:tetratricopeptide (TPR) repeat protein
VTERLTNDQIAAARLRLEAEELYRAGQPWLALELLAREEALDRSIADNRALAVCVSNQAVMLYMNEPERALRLLEEGESICRAGGFVTLLATNLGNQGLALRELSELDRAFAKHEDAARLYREANDKHGLGTCLGNQAMIMADKGDIDAALTMHAQQEDLAREVDDPDLLVSCLANQAYLVATRKNMPVRALRLAGEAHRLASRHKLVGRLAEIDPILKQIRSLVGRT